MKRNRNRTDMERVPGVIAPEIAPPDTVVPKLDARPRSPRPATRYRYRFTPLILCVLWLGVALCVAGFSLTTWFFSDFVRTGDMGNIFAWLKYLLLYFASVGFGLFLAAILARSEYILTDGELIVRLGFLRSRTSLSKIVSVHLFRGTGRLAVYFDAVRTNYLFIVIKESLYDAFVRDLTSRNERIGYSFTTAEEEHEIKKK